MTGCTMETAYGPRYANIFIPRSEQKRIYPFIKDKVELTLRCTDDIFFIWKDIEEELKNCYQ